MSRPEESANFSAPEETRIDEIYSLVSTEFHVLDYYLENRTLTFHVKTNVNVKEAFLKIYRRLKPMGLLPILRREGEKEILRIIEKPPSKRGNTLINLVLFLATLVTTFYTGYLLSGSQAGLNPLFGGVAFMITIMAVLGVHEAAHKFMADRHEIEATLPYFIPSPPQLGIGTFGAVIMQKSPPPNSDALFDVGASGPIAGFIVSVIAILVGLPFSIYDWIPRGSTTLPVPLFFRLVGPYFLPSISNIPPPPGPDFILAVYLHPVAYAGWIGMIVTMLNLLPVGTLDGGHIVESIFKGKARTVFLVFSIALMIFTNFWLMLFFILIFGLYRHPGPLDNISSLSKGRKILAIIILATFILSSPIPVFLL